MSVKVLHLINNLGSGGAEKLLEDLIPLMNNMDNLEADILLLTDKNSVFYDSLINKGIKVDVIKYRKIFDPRNIFAIKKHIVNGEYDIVHSHLFPTQYWVALARLFIKNKAVKFITTEHSTNNKRREKFYYKPIDKFIYSKYDSIISITDKTRDNLINWIDPKRKKSYKYVVIQNGVDIKKIKEALPYKKSELIKGISENTKLVCMIGSFSAAKDQPTLIRAMNKLQKDIHLVLVGEGSLMRDNKKLADQLYISNRVHFLGFRQDIARILKTVDIVVLSSHWEGLSLASIEGMASGKPFIASKVPGLEEIVDGNGFLFEEENYNQLAGLINQLIRDVDIYNQTIINCLLESEKYELKNVLAKLLELYKNINQF